MRPFRIHNLSTISRPVVYTRGGLCYPVAVEPDDYTFHEFSMKTDVITIAPADFAQLAREILIHPDRTLSFQARGSSMAPFIRDRDILTVVPAEIPRLRRGDIVLYQRIDGSLIAHRILARVSNHTGGLLQTRGDSHGGPRESIRVEQVLGKVIGIRRGTKNMRPDGRLSRLAALAWSGIQPLRIRLSGMARRARKIVRTTRLSVEK